MLLLFVCLIKVLWITLAQYIFEICTAWNSLCATHGLSAIKQMLMSHCCTDGSTPMSSHKILPSSNQTSQKDPDASCPLCKTGAACICLCCSTKPHPSDNRTLVYAIPTNYPITHLFMWSRWVIGRCSRGEISTQSDELIFSLYYMSKIRLHTMSL